MNDGKLNFRGDLHFYSLIFKLTMKIKDENLPEYRLHCESFHFFCFLIVWVLVLFL